jgi:hypothetical protein
VALITQLLQIAIEYMSSALEEEEAAVATLTDLPVVVQVVVAPVDMLPNFLQCHQIHHIHIQLVQAAGLTVVVEIPHSL